MLLLPPDQSLAGLEERERQAYILPSYRATYRLGSPDSSFLGGQIFQSQGLVSIDRSMVAALLSTTPRLTPRSSANDLAPLHCTGIDIASAGTGSPDRRTRPWNR